jgi:hypothetical protein
MAVMGVKVPNQIYAGSIVAVRLPRHNLSFGQMDLMTKRGLM